MQHNGILIFPLLIIILVIILNDAKAPHIADAIRKVTDVIVSAENPLADRFFAMTSPDSNISNKVVLTKSFDELPPVPANGFLRMNFNDSTDSDQLWDYKKHHHGELSKS